ncbi:unnamed protein product [Darwinula stevensoni]|uniref:Protein max n=1 Tax=Darwinula stevensoni TaxID=69355 RepID=A0A7R8X879_9CRUS|nr:unnamed protein product [Darwinula stevensoni]CAG0889824.1 unnamed protein product [Darwinula stevensoni]
MSDDDRDIDIDSDDEPLDSYDGASGRTNIQYQSQAEKRAHHNALERRRRDHIKDSFSSLRDCVPSLQGEKSSRATILKKAAEYIQLMRKRNSSHQQDIDDLKKQNQILEQQIRALDKAKSTGRISPLLGRSTGDGPSTRSKAADVTPPDSNSSGSDSDLEGRRPPKRIQLLASS